jgi:predicted choloylglycine hydrolase
MAGLNIGLSITVHSFKSTFTLMSIIMRNAFFFVLIMTSLAVFGQSTGSKREIREVKLSGSGYELGLQHGKLLNKEIAEIIKRMKQNMAKGNEDPEQVIKAFFAYAQFTDDIKKYAPELYEEVRGIADGSGQPFNDIMVLNLLDEFWVYLNNQQNIENHHCSGMGVPSINGSKSYIAQNMDIEPYTDGFQILIRLSRTRSRPEQFILTYPGCIALNGMNETGIGACMNTLMQLKASPKGLPVAFIVRRIINSQDRDELLYFMKTVPHASGQNYIIGIRGEVYDFEASANKVVRFNPNHANGTVYHTNHPIVNDDVKPWFAEFSPKATEKPTSSNTYIRLASVQSRVSDQKEVDDDLIKATLRSKDDPENPVCRSVSGAVRSFTFVSVIMTLTGVPYLQVTAGAPDESAYKRIDFSRK